MRDGDDAMVFRCPPTFEFRLAAKCPSSDAAESTVHPHVAFLALLPALSLADTMGATAFAGAAVAMNDDEGHSKTATADDATGLESGNVEDVSDAGPPPPPHKCEDCKRA